MLKIRFWFMSFTDDEKIKINTPYDTSKYDLILTMLHSTIFLQRNQCLSAIIISKFSVAKNDFIFLKSLMFCTTYRE